MTVLVGHNCALDGVHVVDIPDDGHSGPVVGEVALSVGVPLAEDHSSQATGLSGEAESADSREETDVGVIAHNSERNVILHALCAGGAGVAFTSATRPGTAGEADAPTFTTFVSRCPR